MPPLFHCVCGGCATCQRQTHGNFSRPSLSERQADGAPTARHLPRVAHPGSHKDDAGEDEKLDALPAPQNPMRQGAPHMQYAPTGEADRVPIPRNILRFAHLSSGEDEVEGGQELVDGLSAWDTALSGMEQAEFNETSWAGLMDAEVRFRGYVNAGREMSSVPNRRWVLRETVGTPSTVNTSNRSTMEGVISFGGGTAHSRPSSSDDQLGQITQTEPRGPFQPSPGPSGIGPDNEAETNIAAETNETPDLHNEPQATGNIETDGPAMATQGVSASSVYEEEQVEDWPLEFLEPVERVPIGDPIEVIDISNLIHEPEAGSTCAICLEEFPNTYWPSNDRSCRELDACPGPKHRFHSKCLETWVNMGRATSHLCPICREEMCSPRETVPVLTDPAATGGGPATQHALVFSISDMFRSEQVVRESGAELAELSPGTQTLFVNLFNRMFDEVEPRFVENSEAEDEEDEDEDEDAEMTDEEEYSEYAEYGEYAPEMEVFGQYMHESGWSVAEHGQHEENNMVDEADAEDQEVRQMLVDDGFFFEEPIDFHPAINAPTAAPPHSGSNAENDDAEYDGGDLDGLSDGSVEDTDMTDAEDDEGENDEVGQ